MFASQFYITVNLRLVNTFFWSRFGPICLYIFNITRLTLSTITTCIFLSPYNANPYVFGCMHNQEYVCIVIVYNCIIDLKLNYDSIQLNQTKQRTDEKTSGTWRVVDAMTKLLGLYEEPEKPEDALD